METDTKVFFVELHMGGDRYRIFYLRSIHLKNQYRIRYM